MISDDEHKHEEIEMSGCLTSTPVKVIIMTMEGHNFKMLISSYKNLFRSFSGPRRRKAGGEQLGSSRLQ